MKDWGESLQYLKDFLNTLAGKLTAILAFALLVIIVLGWLGASIPQDYRVLVYIVVIGAMLIFFYQAIAKVREKHHQNAAPTPETTPQPEPPKNHPPVVDASAAREAYLRAVMEDNRTLRLVGLDPQAADPSRGGLTLEALYVSLDTTTTIEINEKTGRSTGIKSSQENDETLETLTREKSRPLSALEALSDNSNRRMVLLGLPGTGKSTFARYLALRMAQAEFDPTRDLRDLLPGWQGGTVMPLVISLGRMAESIPAGCLKGHTGLIETYVNGLLAGDERTQDYAERLLPTLKESGGLVLFDGLDEVADLNLRPVVVQAVEDFVQIYSQHPTSRFLVTCRTYSYHHDSRWQLTGWPTHELALLDEEKIQQFVQAWHDEHARIEPARKADFERKRQALLASLHPDDRRRLHEIAPFPIILTMMAVVHTHYGELPDTRAQVYEKCVDLLLVRWEVERPVAGQAGKVEKRTIVDALGVLQVNLYRPLWEVAYKAHQSRGSDSDHQRGPALVTEDLLSGVLQAHLQNLDKVKLFLEYCQSSNGLLMLQGTVSLPDSPEGTPPRKVYAFPHLTFEEYLAARYLVGQRNFGKLTAGLVKGSDRWREVVLLMGEHLCFALGEQERMDTLVNSLLPTSAPAKESGDWRAVWLAGDLLTLYQRAFPGDPPSHLRTVIDGLKKLVFTSGLAPRERAAAADTLDELGYLPPDLYTFVALDNFSIGKYPVTNRQYARFLEPGNFDVTNQDLWFSFPKFSAPDKNGQVQGLGDWGQAGWTWLQGALAAKDSLVENGVLYPRYWRDPRFGLARPSAPVVGVSWWEASAYCKWLHAHWEELEEGRQGLVRPNLLRLPTEPEWQQAAGGTTPRERYAWDQGKEATNELADILQRANIDKSGINRTTPVWMYPRGASPSGVLDLSGNVWEWQANFYDKDQDVLSVRGGSWFGSRGFARVSLRYGFHPDLRYYFIGFRVLSPRF